VYCCRCRPTASATPVYMNQPFKLDYVWAALCLVGAAYFIFRA
jgi:uncharacterized protein (DUF486 family)